MAAAVFFDLDGTLADTAPDLGAALNRLRADEGRAPLPMAVLRPHVSAGTRGMLGIGFGLMPGDAGYEPLRQRFLAHYEAALCVGTTLFAGMAALLDAIEARGLPWGIVTNKPQRYTLPLAEALAVRRRACCVVGGDSAPRPKPDPAPILMACAIAGVSPREALYVGDDLRDIQAGRAAGLRTVAAAYGYLGVGQPLDTWQADLAIATPEALIAELPGAC